MVVFSTCVRNERLQELQIKVRGKRSCMWTLKNFKHWPKEAALAPCVCEGPNKARTAGRCGVTTSLSASTETNGPHPEALREFVKKNKNHETHSRGVLILNLIECKSEL